MGVLSTFGRWEAPHSAVFISKTGDDIVHPFWKQEDKCNQLVAGSNPARGANTKKSPKMVLFGILRGSNIEYFELNLKQRQELFEKGFLGFEFGDYHILFTKA